MSSIKNYVKDQIELINNGDKKKWMKTLCNAEKFLFTYDSIADSNPNPGHNIEKFWRKQFIAV